MRNQEIINSKFNVPTIPLNPPLNRNIQFHNMIKIKGGQGRKLNSPMKMKPSGEKAKY